MRQLDYQIISLFSNPLKTISIYYPVLTYFIPVQVGGTIYIMFYACFVTPPPLINYNRLKIKLVIFEMNNSVFGQSQNINQIILNTQSKVILV